MNPNFLPYNRHQVDDHDIEAVVGVLNSPWLTTGCKITEFEEALAGYCRAKYAVAVSSGTAALHCAAYAAGIGPGDEVIVPAMTFAATAGCVAVQGARPVIVDVDPDTLLVNPSEVEKCINRQTKAIIAVDYAGQPCNYRKLRDIAHRHGLVVIADACHALGAASEGVRTGQLADMTVFSFHPAKHITTGEGGIIVTDSAHYADKMRRFRNHGITADFHQRRTQGTWFYEVIDFGYNYRITDIQCALGLSQLNKLDCWIAKRRTIAARYAQAFEHQSGIRPLAILPGAEHVYHLYVIRLDERQGPEFRTSVFKTLQDQGIGANVHYIPLNLHPFYQKKFGARPGQCPQAEAAYESILSLPIFPAMIDQDVDRVCSTLETVISGNAR